MNIHYHPHFLHQLHIEERISIMEGKSSDGQFLPLMPANTFQTSIKYYFLNKNIFNCREVSFITFIILHKKKLLIMKAQQMLIRSLTLHYYLAQNQIK